MRPFKVNSLAEFVETYGNPIPGAYSGDVWREGNKTGPTYAAYAAFAWLNAGVAPANIVRLLGDEHDQNDGTVAAQAGWTTTDPASTSTARSADAYGSAADTNLDQNGGAYGLWIIPSGSDMNNVKGTTFGTGSLAAVWYMRKGAVVLKGKQVSHRLQSELSEVTGAAVMIHSEDSNYTFQAEILDTATPIVNYTQQNLTSTEILKITFVRFSTLIPSLQTLVLSIPQPLERVREIISLVRLGKVTCSTFVELPETPMVSFSP